MSISNNIFIEACCGSADDVFEAAKSGVRRVELNSAMFLGGLTPSIGEVKVALGSGVSIMAMIRPRQGGFAYTEKEYETMLFDADMLLGIGVNGIVFGILNADGTVDVERCKPLVDMAKARNRETVFHRAVDVTPDWRQALDALISLGINRVLTSGQQPNARDGAATISAMREYGNGRIEILPGAGITLMNAKSIIEETGCNQLHVLLEKHVEDNSTASGREIFFGGALYPPENIFGMADCTKFSELILRLNNAF